MSSSEWVVVLLAANVAVQVGRLMFDWKRWRRGR
jgi:hypothetical protein